MKKSYRILPIILVITFIVGLIPMMSIPTTTIVVAADATKNTRTRASIVQMAKALQHEEFDYNKDFQEYLDDCIDDDILGYLEDEEGFEQRVAIEYVENMYYKTNPFLTTPYLSGSLETKPLNDALNAMKMVRYLAGLSYEDMALTEKLNNSAQHRAVLAAVTGKVGHDLQKPTDMSDIFYNAGLNDGIDQCELNHVLGGNPIKIESTAKAIIGLVGDGGFNNIESAGHRMAIFNPNMKEFGIGYANDFNDPHIKIGNKALYTNYLYAHTNLSSGSSETVDTYTAWPNSGAFPIEYFDDSTRPWSITLGTEYQAPTKTNISITLTRTRDSKTWTFNNSTPNLGASNTDYDNKALNHLAVNGKNIIFRPNLNDLGEIKAGDYFTLNLSGIRNSNNQAATLQYNIDFFDLEKAMEDEGGQMLLESALPASGSRYVPCDTIIELTFNRPISLVVPSVDERVRLYKKATNELVAITYGKHTSNQFVLQIIPKSLLEENTEYYLEIDNNVIMPNDNNYFDGFAGNQGYYFTTNDGETQADVPVISTQPKDVSCNQGQLASLSVLASVSKGNLSYQWYSNSNRSNIGGTLINGATKSTYPAPTNATGIKYYYCIIRNTDSTATGSKIVQVISDVARVTVYEMTQVKLAFEDKYISIPWEIDYFFSKSASEDEPKTSLAVAGLALINALYKDTNGNQTIGNRHKETFGKLGFNENEVELHGRSAYDFQNAYHAIAHSRVMIDGKACNIIGVVIRGTGGDEWLSTLDIRGDNRENTRKNVEDIENCVYNIEDNIRQYIRKNVATGEELKFFITGHSRGGAAADLLGYRLTDSYNKGEVLSYKTQNKNGKDSVFAYAFASLNANFQKDISYKYKNIINISNKEDVAPSFPWSIYKFGRVIEVNRENNPIFNDRYKELTGNNYPLWNNPLNAHSNVTYMALVLTEQFTNNRTPVRITKVKCPVDVEVYNSLGVLVGKVVDNKIDESFNQEILISIIDDEKSFLLPFDEDYTFKLLGTDNGTMTYSVEDTNPDTWDVLKQNEFKNVSLFAGKTMLSEVRNGMEVSDVKLFLTDGNKIIGEINEDGTEVLYANNSNGPIPATGDIRNYFYFLLVLIAFSGILLMSIKKRRKVKV